MDRQIEILARQPVYSGFFRMDKLNVKHTLFAGGWSRELTREFFYRGACAAVLLYDPDTNSVVLIEQFRVGALIQPDRAWLVEIVAGAIEAGETAEAVAYREAQEEAGCNIQALLPIYTFYTTPGCSSERISLLRQSGQPQHWRHPRPRRGRRRHTCQNRQLCRGLCHDRQWPH